MSGKQKDGIVLERSFLLRLPQPQSETVSKAINAGFVKDFLSIEFQGDYRHSTVRVGKSALAGKLMDLPTIIESFKTVDKKSFYKTSDICQILVCTEDNDDINMDLDDAEQTNNNKENKFLFNHGVTVPLKNVRKGRFRKTARQKHQECPEVKRELERLLRADVQAENVTFEVLADEEKSEEKPSLVSSPLPSDMQLTEDHLAFLQEPISDEDDELDIENSQKETRKSDLQISEGDQESLLYSEKEKDQEIDVLSDLASVTADHCEELRLKIDEQKIRIEKAENPFLKQRFQSTLEKLQQQLNDKEL